MDLPTLVRYLVATLLVTVLTASSLMIPIHAQETEPRAYLDDLPELLDLEMFFGDPETASASLSPDGTYTAFLRPHDGVMNVWVKETGASFDEAEPITADERPVFGFFWSQDERYILYVQDEDGDENLNVFAVDPTAERDSDTGVPEARNLTPLDGVRAQIYAVPDERPGEMFIGLNERDPAYHDLYLLDINTGEKELIWENEQQLGTYVFDLDANLRLTTRELDYGGTEVLRIDDGELERIYECTFEETCSPMRFHVDGERVYMNTNAGEDVDLARLTLLNVVTGEEEVIESDPEDEVDLGNAIFSPDTDKLQATAYVGDRVRIYPKDDDFAASLEKLEEQLPDGEISISSRTDDESLWVISLSRDVDPGTTYLYDRTSGEVQELYRSRPEINPEQMAHMEPVRYEARDGLEIPAYLTIPQGVEPENLSVIVLPHGGPWARDFWGFNSYVQFFANRGYAVFQPNFRGSTGFGQEFLNAGNMEWGTGYMQHDITDGVQFLIDEGIADPDHVGIFGISYGGYATLAGLTFTPDLYAAGISFVGPSNLITLLNSIPPYWATQREQMFRRMGDPDDPEDRERLKEQSPFFHADQITAPLMVIQGANDPRVRQAESDQIVVALRDRGYDVDYLLAEDEGHGFRDETNRIASVAAMEQFFASYLGGRQQESYDEAITERLEELRVDISTVELPDMDELAEAEEADLPEADGSVLSESTLNYSARIETGQGSADLELRRTIEEAESDDGQALLRIINETEAPMGTSVDTFVVDRQTLRPHRLYSAAGQATLHLSYSEDRITGTIDAGGQHMTVDEELDNPVLSYGAALEMTIAALPLEEGYETTLRYYDPQQQSIRVMRLSVEDAASTEVPAGTFETWHLRMSPLDDGDGATAMFVKRDKPHHLVKSESELPAQMGGGTATTVLESKE